MIVSSLWSLRLYSQNMYQESFVELNETLNGSESYICEATTSIKLLPGFEYKPESDENMVMKIDRYSVFPPTDGLYSGGYDGGGVVGSLPGTFSTTNTGAAVYSVDLKLPNAIGSMVPKISFVYNNQSTNGIMGWAWNLSGLSSIERVGQTEYHDGKVTSVDFVNDRFAMDGQRLMLVDGTYGGDNAEYKVEFDNMDRIVSYSKGTSPESFQVWKSDGTIWEYGTSADSRIESMNDKYVVIRWLLHKISDRDGNAIVFNYDKDIREGESYINNIEYTSNAKAGIRPAYRVLFVYEDRMSDVNFSYVYGNKKTNGRILKNVVVLNNYTRKVLYNYSLDYYSPGLYGRNYFVHYRLKSMGLTIGEDKINSTQIIWNAEEKHYPSHLNNFQMYQLDKSVFSNVPFVGDFNGDGFSDVMTVPYKMQDTYPDDVVAKVYLNNGDGTFQNSPMTSISLSKNLEWIYVVDLNEDGIDDIIPCEFNHGAQSQDDNIVTMHFYLMEKGSFVKKTSYFFKNNVVIMPGRFYSNKNGVFVVDAFDGSDNDDRASYIYFVNGRFSKITIYKSDVINGIDANLMAIDVTGDGVSEILALRNDGYEIYKTSISNMYEIELFSSGSSMTKDVYPFPNDFNGDGKTDILYYDNSRTWNIVFSMGNGFTRSMVCSNTSLLRSISLNAKDKYQYSLREMSKPSVTIRTADFDGDGTADVGVFKNMGGNYYLELGLMPFVKSDNTIDFAYTGRYYMPINYSHQTIQIGRFLPQENVSILSGLPRSPLSTQKAYITSLYPHSAYYGVERIIDGMGNVRGFSYDYLMCRNKIDDGFYTCDNGVYENNIRKNSIPTSALKTDTVFSINGKHIVTKYKYHNALLHTKGHGFLGFERVETKNYLEGNPIQKEEKYYSYNLMGSHSVSLPYLVRLYQGEKQLVREKTFCYEKYICNSNDKVVVPLTTYCYDTEYCLDRQGVLKRQTIERNTYRSDNGSNKTYDKVIQLELKTTGFTDEFAVSEPENCTYVKEEYTIFDNDISNWIINRPKKIYSYIYDKNEESIGRLKIFSYDEKSPLRIVGEMTLPNLNEDYSDPLSLNIEYDYDVVGNMTSKTVSSPSIDVAKTTKYEYDNTYRYRIKTIDELGRVVKCNYDDDYGMLLSTVDFNDFVTLSEKNPAGVTDMITMPDGMQKAKALRWSVGNEYAPHEATYYSWEKSTAMSEVMTFYHKNGMELRTVTFDINGNAVYVDKTYDDFGNLKQKSLPYYQGEECLNVTNVYDSYNRIVEVKHPNGVRNTVFYNGNNVIKETLGLDGERLSNVYTYNFMDWLVETKESAGNAIKYEYCCDGKIKSAYIDGNPQNKVTLTYDNCRNKKTLNDPNYGMVLYEYDALGYLKKITNAKEGVIENEYDVSGRMVAQTIKDAMSKKEVKTNWVYDVGRGKNGLLKRIVTSDMHRVDYVYDEKLRLVEEIETIHGNEYRTIYGYDKANRIATVTYPSGVTISKVFSNSGYEKEVLDVAENKILWRTNNTNPNGFITECLYGNGIKTETLYDDKTFFVERIVATDDNSTIQDLSYKYDDFGNLLHREKSTGTNVLEEFEYDDWNRLVEVRLNGTTKARMSYDNLGNILEKEIDDVRVIYSAMYHPDRPNAIFKAKTDDDSMLLSLKQNMKYTSFDNLLSITKDDGNLLIDYGYDQNRIYMSSNVAGRTKTKTYVGACEIVEQDGRRDVYTFIEGPGGIFAVCVIDEKGNKSYNYIHKDNLGSWNIITDEAGNVVQEVSFDAWGNIRDYDEWISVDEEQTLLFDRGFTGHEHLQDFGLINMNGRIYDPVMSMMLSPDNNIQMPQMSQNFNRYSYCLNNPLRYEDPTGELVESLAFGVVGGAANVLFNAKNIDSFGEFALLFGVGFTKGFLAQYMIAQSWLLQVGVQTVIGGVSAAANQMVSIGDGTFQFSGDDWNSIKTAFNYGIGNSLVMSFMETDYITATEYELGNNIIYLFPNEDLAYSFTSLAAHGMGCWFSGQPFLVSMRFKDVGFDLKTLGRIVARMLSSYIEGLQFADDVVKQRGQELKDMIYNDIISEDPDCPDFEYTYQVKFACVENGRVYISGNIFVMIPGEIFEVYPKPYYGELISFPFSYSLFKTLFFNNQ